jgi:hypothetical protein
MKHLIMILVLMLAFSSCTKTNTPTPIQTVTAELVGTGLATSFIKLGNCKGVTIINSDFMGYAKNWFGIEANKMKQAGIGADICKIAVSEIIPLVVGTGSAIVVKPEYQCDFSGVTDIAVALSAAACASIP